MPAAAAAAAVAYLAIKYQEFVWNFCAYGSLYYYSILLLLLLSICFAVNLLLDVRVIGTYQSIAVYNTNLFWLYFFNRISFSN